MTRDRATHYKCDAGHEFYSYSTKHLRECAYGRCGAAVVAVKGPLAATKDRP